MSACSVYKQNDQLYIQTWKKHVSQKQLIKFIPNAKNDLYHFLQQSSEGRLCLNLFHNLTKYAAAKDNSSFLLTVEAISKHLECYPTLIASFPMQILNNLRMLRKFACTNKMKNIIYLTCNHKLPCTFCGKTIIGNEAKRAVCLCSTQFYHYQCFNSIQGKCKICGYIFES